MYTSCSTVLRLSSLAVSRVCRVCTLLCTTVCTVPTLYARTAVACAVPFRDRITEDDSICTQYLALEEMSFPGNSGEFTNFFVLCVVADCTVLFYNALQNYLMPSSC